MLRKASRSGKIVHAPGIEPAMLSRGPSFEKTDLASLQEKPLIHTHSERDTARNENPPK